MPLDILIPFLTIGLAELLDKSQLSILLLSSRTKNYFQLFLGVMLAFLFVDGTAILIGSFITTLLPTWVITTFTALLFIIFGLLSFRKTDKESPKNLTRKSAFLTGFMLIAITEWGDKTQLASALFATQFNPLLVLIGVIMSLALLTIVTIAAGQFIIKLVSKETINKIAGIIFILLGLFFLSTLIIKLI